MGEVQQRFGHVPLAPFVAWTTQGQDLALGMGDLLMASTFGLAAWKAYGRRAGVVAIGGSFLGIQVVLGLLELQIVHRLLPAMVVLGPLIVTQYLIHRHRNGTERTMKDYLAAESLPNPSLAPQSSTPPRHVDQLDPGRR